MESSRYKVAPYVTGEKRDGNFSMRLCFKLNYNYRLCVRKGIIPSLAKPHRKRFLSAFVQDNVDLLLSQRKLEFTFIRSLFVFFDGSALQFSSMNFENQRARFRTDIEKKIILNFVSEYTKIPNSCSTSGNSSQL